MTRISTRRTSALAAALLSSSCSSLPDYSSHLTTEPDATVHRADAGADASFVSHPGGFEFRSYSDFLALKFVTLVPDPPGTAYWGYVPGPPPAIVRSDYLNAANPAYPDAAYAVWPEPLDSVTVTAYLEGLEPVSNPREGGLVAHFRDPGQMYRLALVSSGASRAWELVRVLDGTVTRLACGGDCGDGGPTSDAAFVPVQVLGRRLRLEVRSDRTADVLGVFIDDQPMQTVTVTDPLPPGATGIYCSRVEGANFTAVSVSMP